MDKSQVYNLKNFQRNFLFLDLHYLNTLETVIAVRSTDLGARFLGSRPGPTIH